MTITKWLPGAHIHDLSAHRGNGPFTSRHPFLGVVLHVNESENGTSDAFFSAGPPTNPNYVTPNFQVYKDGSIHQYLPFNWQPWCQIDGNFNYAAIETAGLHSEPLTHAQEIAIARILSVYHHDMGMELVVTNTPGHKGFGTHSMGGASWGGHPCPGTLRAGERTAILDLAGVHVPIYHVVVKGDTLYALANHYHVTVAQLEAWNPHANPVNLVIGSKLRVSA